MQDHTAPSGNGISRGLWSLLGRGIGIDEARLPQYISNLDRLGILRVEMQSSTPDYHAYDKIEVVVYAALNVADPNRGLLLTAARISVTALGAQFLETCVRVHVPAARFG